VLVSVILPVYNREHSLPRAIESVLRQTYRDLELIVIDDGSTDGTRAAAERYAPRVRVLDQPHRGPYAARNLGLQHARGELVAFIDSDDAWLPDKLALQVPLMRRPEVGLVFGDVVHLPARKKTSFQVAPPRRGRVAARFAWCNFVPTITVLARKRCLEEAGGFAEVPLAADYLMWFRIALRHELDYVGRPVAEYTVHAEGISFDLGRSLLARIRLFSAELARTRDRTTRAIIRALLLNLSLRLGLAVVRGRARGLFA
jgi:glycosyltransferase involved in cell wall biosynthesis